MIVYDPGVTTLSWKTLRATSVSMTMMKPREGFGSTPTAVPITAAPSIPDGSQTIVGSPLEVGGTEGPSAANRFLLRAVGPGGTQTCSTAVFVIPGCGQLAEEFDNAVRGEKLITGAGAIVSILGFLGGPWGGAISTPVGAGIATAGQKLISAKDACNALAACMQKQGLVGSVSVNNAIGNTIGTCTWAGAGFGNYTN